MRTLKFRAWNQTHKRFFNPLEDRNYTFKHFINKPIFPVEQFTGLLDQKGKEIYEGDLVKFELVEEYDLTGQDEFTGTIEWDEEDTGFFICSHTERFPHIKLWFTNYLEVIGNIHENPELL